MTREELTAIYRMRWSTDATLMLLLIAAGLIFDSSAFLLGCGVGWILGARP